MTNGTRRPKKTMRKSTCEQFSFFGYTLGLCFALLIWNNPVAYDVSFHPSAPRLLDGFVDVFPFCFQELGWFYYDLFILGFEVQQLALFWAELLFYFAGRWGLLDSRIRCLNDFGACYGLG